MWSSKRQTHKSFLIAGSPIDDGNQVNLYIISDISIYLLSDKFSQADTATEIINQTALELVRQNKSIDDQLNIFFFFF